MPEHSRTLFADNLEASEQRFKEEFARELLLSERLRVTILMGVFLFSAAYAALLLLLARGGVLARLPQSDLHIAGVAVAVSLAAVLYEYFMRRFITGRLKQNKPAPAWRWYLNAFIETSIPTLSVYIIGVGQAVPVSYMMTSFVILYAVFIVLSVLRLDARLSFFTGMVAAVGYAMLALYFLSLTPGDADIDPRFLAPASYVTRAVFFLVVGVGAAFVAREVRRRLFHSFVVLEERNQIRDVFGQQTAPAVVEALLNEGMDMKSQRRQVCIMFLDIRGFTAYSEKRDPEEVVAYLNRLFDFMIDLVNENAGIIHQLLGDGFMAIFGAPLSYPNNRRQAVDASLAILDRVAEEHAAGRIPPTRIGIGLHAGEALTGTVGSSIHKEYKVTGDVVNLAARIEQLNKTYDSQLLISEAVWKEVDLPGLDADGIGAVEVRGRAEPVQIYKLA